jgi:hypothetical protein
MRLHANPIVYVNVSVIMNKSVLNWTQVCQLHWKTQLHEIKFWQNQFWMTNQANLFSLMLFYQFCFLTFFQKFKQKQIRWRAWWLLRKNVSIAQYQDQLQKPTRCQSETFSVTYHDFDKKSVKIEKILKLKQKIKWEGCFGDSFVV